MVQETEEGISLPRNPVDTDTVYLIGFEKEPDGHCGLRATPVGEAKTDFLNIGCKALTASRSIETEFDPDAGAEENSTCIVNDDDIWDRHLLNIIDNYENLSLLDSHHDKMFALYAILFIENDQNGYAVTPGQDNDTGSQPFAILKRLDITSTAKRKKLLTLTGSEIKKLEETVLQVSESFDMLYTDNKLYVQNYNAFTYLFRSLQGNENKVDELVSSFEENMGDLVFADGLLDSLKERAKKSVRTANRLNSIVRKYKNRPPSLDQIRTAIEEVDVQDLITIDEGNGTISFEEDDIDKALQFFNEDLFKSAIFSDKYAASGKRKIT